MVLGSEVRAGGALARAAPQMSLLDDLLYDEAALEGSPEPPLRSRAASSAANLCGACAQEVGAFHSCELGKIRAHAEHKVPLHGHVVCEAVVMPITGYYFCSLACVKLYNEAQIRLGITDVMPDDGPGNVSDLLFCFPMRRRPHLPEEVFEWRSEDGEEEEADEEAAAADKEAEEEAEVDEEVEAEAAAAETAEAAAAEAAPVAAATLDAPAEAGELAQPGTRVNVDGRFGVVAKLFKGQVIVAYDDCACTCDQTEPCCHAMLRR